ncbi:hypothetical protein ACFFWC_19880 [Plantactinospora siamensis]|uniref:Uncharacterized protein n=1 Tax=Plantactinospora siamensis TaxID=555372 RepID=A0ABV6P2M9_9ACTN
MKRFAITAVALPLAAAGARGLSRAIEKRRGPSRTSGLLNQAADMIRPAKKSRSRRWR